MRLPRHADKIKCDDGTLTDYVREEDVELDVSLPDVNVYDLGSYSLEVVRSLPEHDAESSWDPLSPSSDGLLLAFLEEGYLTVRPVDAMQTKLTDTGGRLKLMTKKSFKTICDVSLPRSQACFSYSL